MRTTLKLLWNGMASLGWLAVVVLVGPSLMSADSSKRPSGSELDRSPPIFTVTPGNQSDQNGMDAEPARGVRLIGEQQKNDSPVVKVYLPERPGPAQNLHETHQPGEPYPYSFARNKNNELRWTLNEFRWRLGNRPEHRKYWDLQDIDAPLGGDLPEQLDDLRRQNWQLSWRGEQLLRLVQGRQPERSDAPPMPLGTTEVRIPGPACASGICPIR